MQSLVRFEMAASVSEVLEAIRANIASFTGANVTLGSPVDSETGLFIFAYMLSQDLSHRQPLERQAEQNFDVRCLLMPSRSDGHVAIGRGMRYLTEHAMFDLGESKVQLIVRSLSAEELAHIFISAEIALRLAIPFETKCTTRS
jgi:hypothetical protein